jgi:hypothetical protein
MERGAEWNADSADRYDERGYEMGEELNRTQMTQIEQMDADTERSTLIGFAFICEIGEIGGYLP